MAGRRGVKTASGDVIILRSSYAPETKLEAFYTGGTVQITSDGGHMMCMCGSSVKVLHVKTLSVERTLEEEEDVVTTMALSPDDSHLVVGWRSLLLRQYNWKDGNCLRQWKGHLGPVVSMAFDSTSTLLATGSGDGSVKVWDCVKQYCTHNLKGSGGMVSLVRFHPLLSSNLRLYTSAADCSIQVWDLASSRCLQTLCGHVSPVTSLSFSADGQSIISSGRDKVLHVWDHASGKMRKTLPVFEAVEGMVCIPSDEASAWFKSDRSCDRGCQTHNPIVVATAGNKGVIRLWEAESGRLLHSLQPLDLSAHLGNSGPKSGKDSEDSPDQTTAQTYMDLLLCTATHSLVGITFDQNIVFYNLMDSTRIRECAGFLDEVLDIKCAGRDQGLVAIATNSEQVKIYNRDSVDCSGLVGHSEVVLCLDVSADGSLILTGSKDNTIRSWRLNESGSEFSCCGIGYGHTSSAGAVACARLKPIFVMSGSHDHTIKLWNLKGLSKWREGDQPTRLPVLYTQIAHDKDINSLDVSPNDKLVVSGSQDRTAKLWQVSDGSLLGTFRGHRRGVWSCCFSPVDQCVATSSADGSIKLWSVGDFSCLKTFEGHSNSVLRVVFITRGMQLASAGNDGLIKIWIVKTQECVATLDLHTDRVWALTAIDDGNILLSGGADSLVCRWQDVTEKVQLEQQAARDAIILREQELQNLLQKRDYVSAVGLAITLDQPLRVLTILTELLDKGDIEGDFRETIVSLREDQIQILIQYSVKWNTNSKYCRVAQSVLFVLFKTHPPSKLAKIDGIKEALEGLIPYTEKHFQRLSKLQQLSSFVRYSWQCIKLSGADNGEMDVLAGAVTSSSPSPIHHL